MKRKMSLKIWLTLTLGTLLTVLVIAFFLVGRYAEQTMRRNAVRFNENLLQVYMEKLDESIDGITRFLSRYAASQAAISVLARSTEESERFFAAQEITRQLETGAFLYDNFSGLFVYSDSPVGQRFLCQMRGHGSQAEADEIRDLVTSGTEVFSTNGWDIFVCGEKTYLIQAVRTGSTSCGAWIDVEDLVLPMQGIELGEEGRVLFLDGEGYALPRRAGDEPFAQMSPGGTVVADGIRFLAISHTSTRLPVTLAVLIPEREFLRDIRIYQVVAVVLCMVLLCCPLLWYTLHRFISTPVDQLTQAMQKVEEGCLDVRVRPDFAFYEFQLIGERFNHMVQRIRRLQQDVYERQLQLQKTQLQYLQMQIRPHFFLNALNSLYAYVLTSRYDLVERLTLCLSQYFRYMLGSSAAFVTLGKELEHVENYMQIQQLRKPGHLAYTQEVEAALLDALIPPLLVQTFVENSIKYGEPGQGTPEIGVFAEPVLDGTGRMRITVTDNGRGYPEPVLAAQNAGGQPAEGNTHGIGIENARRRLALTYGADASLHIGNGSDGGAVAEIFLPLRLAAAKEEAVRDDDSAGG